MLCVVWQGKVTRLDLDERGGLRARADAGKGKEGKIGQKR